MAGTCITDAAGTASFFATSEADAAKALPKSRTSPFLMWRFPLVAIKESEKCGFWISSPSSRGDYRRVDVGMNTNRQHQPHVSIMLLVESDKSQFKVWEQKGNLTYVISDRSNIGVKVMLSGICLSPLTMFHSQAGSLFLVARCSPGLCSTSTSICRIPGSDFHRLKFHHVLISELITLM